MTSAARMKGVYNKTPIDRVPVTITGSVYAAYVTGYSSREYYTNTDITFAARKGMDEVHAHDGRGRMSYSVPESGCWDFGGELLFKESPRISLPVAKRRPVQTEADLEGLVVPTVKTGIYSKSNFEFNKEVFKKGYNVGLTLGSALDTAHSIVGIELLMKWMLRKPQLVHDLMEKVCQYYQQIIDAYIEEFGAENLGVSANFPMESNDLISPKMFEVFSLPYIVRIHQYAMERGIKKWTLHLCGNHHKNMTFWKHDIPLMPRTNFLLSHEFDPLEFADYMGDDYIISGNLWTRTLNSGTPEDVYEEARGIIEKMKYTPGGFILAPDCATPPTTPPANIEAMIKAAENFGSYE